MMYFILEHKICTLLTQFLKAPLEHSVVHVDLIRLLAKECHHGLSKLLFSLVPLLFVWQSYHHLKRGSVFGRVVLLSLANCSSIFILTLLTLFTHCVPEEP